MEAEEQQSLRATLERRVAFLHEDPDNPHLLREAIDLSTRLGEFEQAAELLNRAQRRFPGDAGFRFQRATAAMATGDYEVAETLLATVLEAGESHPAVRYNLALARLQLRRFAAAREALSDFTDEDWRVVPQASLVFARAAYQEADTAAARERLEAYLSGHPEDGEARGLLALVCYDGGDRTAARDAADTALRYRPDNGEALLALGGIALDEQDAEKALETMGEAVRINPHHGRAWSGLAFARMLELDLEQAQRDFEKAVELMPNHIGTWHGLAWLQILKDDFEGAERSMERAMELDRNFAETHGTLAVIAVLAGHGEDAPPSIKRALRLDRHSFAGRFAQTLLLSQRGDQTRAAALIEKMADSDLIGGQGRLQDMVARVMARKMKKDSGKEAEDA